MSKNEIQLFNHEEFGEIRTIEIDGEIYFVGLDVAKVLKYKNPWTALANHVHKEDKMSISINLLHEEGNKRGNPNRTVINESGLYSLILARKIKKSDTPNFAETIKKFQRWVTSEVLPSIRKTCTYLENFVDKQKNMWYNITVECRTHHFSTSNS